MNRVLSVKRKGSNDSFGYTEYFLHNAFQTFGYYLTRDEDTTDFIITAYIDHRKEYMLFTSPFFDQLKEENLWKYAESLALSMKSEAIFFLYEGKIETKGVAISQFRFSKTTNAFAEPAVIKTGKCILEAANRNFSLGKLGGFGLTVINYGGPSQGLDIIIETSFSASLSLKIENAQIRRYTKKGMTTEQLSFKKIDNQYICQMDDFIIHPGLNKNSAVWCRSRTKYQDAKFYMDFIITSSAPIDADIKLTVKPHLGDGFTI